MPSSRPATKPILKHRSIMELLTSDLPSSPMFSPPDSDEDELLRVHSDHEPPKHLTGPGVPEIIKRPPLMHTKSDTHISRWGPNHTFRRDSPPRIIASGPSVTSEKPPTSPQGSSSDAVIVPGQKRKHISFNTFVEQCIAIEKPKKKRTMWNVEYPHSKAVDSRYGEEYGADDDGSVSGCSLRDTTYFPVDHFFPAGMTKTLKMEMGSSSMKWMSFFSEMKTTTFIHSHIHALLILRVLVLLRIRHIHSLPLRHRMPPLCRLPRKKMKMKSLRCALDIPALHPHYPHALPRILLLLPLLPPNLAHPKLAPHHIRIIARLLIALHFTIGDPALIPSCEHVVRTRSLLLLRS